MSEWDKGRRKVFVAILNQGNNQAGLESQLIDWMREYAERYDFNFFPAKYAYRPIPNNRNMIVRDFLATDSQYLVMIDDDNPPTANFFGLLSLEKEVIGLPTPGRGSKGLYWMVFGPPETKESPEGMRTFYKHFPVDGRKGLVQVGAISTGCIILRRDVLEKVKKPFEDVFGSDGVLLNNDDLAFAVKCRDLGISIWAHFDFFCSHYKTVDLLQMIREQNKMYDLGFENGTKFGKGEKITLKTPEEVFKA